MQVQKDDGGAAKSDTFLEYKGFVARNAAKLGQEPCTRRNAGMPICPLLRTCSIAKSC
jgi:hypothetical protein